MKNIRIYQAIKQCNGTDEVINAIVDTIEELQEAAEAQEEKNVRLERIGKRYSKMQLIQIAIVSATLILQLMILSRQLGWLA